MTKLAVLGSGSVGRALAAGFTKAGHRVVLASRTPAAEELRSWAVGAGVGVALPADAVRDADIVINATPGDATVDAVGAAGVADRDGTVLLDVSNPLDFSGDAPNVFTGTDDSVGERLQRAFPELRVVKSLCTVNNPLMVDPGLLPEPTTMFIAGDDADAKRTVGALLCSVGWLDEHILDVGGIEAARQLELNILFWLRIHNAVGGPTFNIKVVRG